MAPQGVPAGCWCGRSLFVGAVALISTSVAHGAVPRSVLLDACLSRSGPGCGELVRDLLSCAEVHLVRRLSLEGGVGDPSVVLGDVELDQAADLGGGVEVVQEQPLVL